MTEPARAKVSVKHALVSTVLIRGCWVCGHPREVSDKCPACDAPRQPGKPCAAVMIATGRPCGEKRPPAVVPCAGCGCSDPPVVHELGVQSATFRNPAKRLWWSAVGQPLAARRAKKAAGYSPPVV